MVRIALPPACRPEKGGSLDLYKIDAGGTDRSETEVLAVAAVKKELNGNRSRLARRIQSITWEAWESGIRKDIQPQAEERRTRGIPEGARQEQGCCERQDAT